MMTMAVTHPKQSDIWWLFLLQGAAGIILGLMLLTAPGLTTVALVTFLGYYWLIMGIRRATARGRDSPHCIGISRARLTGG